MTSEQTISCYLIGVESLLAECGQVLKDAGADIRGVVSDAALITQWAEREGIATIAPDAVEETLARLEAEGGSARGLSGTLERANSRRFSTSL